MRIIIDLQGDQSTSSRNRGIGRYSLSIAQGIARSRGNHEVIIALSSAFPDSIEPLIAAFEGLLPAENIRVWDSIRSVSCSAKSDTFRRLAAEKIREAFLASLQPDVIFVTSLLEGFSDDTVTSVASINNGIPTVTVLYDLIPYIYQDIYLSHPDTAAWYYGKVEHLKKSSMLLAISDASRQDAIKHLGISVENVVNIAAAAGPHFKPLRVDEMTRLEVLAKYGLVKPFLMYTGGIDYRKNIEGLIRAYSLLPPPVRKAHQLAVVCSIQPSARAMLKKLAADHGLSDEDLVLTGFVSEDDLMSLYNLSKAFVFPSKYEGFGLPALEAMSCGIATIASNNSSLPEVVGREDALFDPHSDQGISSKMHQLLVDDGFREGLAKSGLERARLFSWDASAKKAISAFERVHANRMASLKKEPTSFRPKLAYVSPLPPDKSGIADYSADLISAMVAHYEITLITPQPAPELSRLPKGLPVRNPQWLLDHRDEFDRVLYHFGNSDFHSHMFPMLEELAGVVVLHDFYLSGILNHLEHQEGMRHYWSRHIFDSHGYPALIEKLDAADSSAPIWKYPGNVSVLNQARHVIVHSENSAKMAASWFGEDASAHWSTIPLLKIPAKAGEKARSRETLGVSKETFLVCSFGLLGSTKLNDRLIKAWMGSQLAGDKNATLVFVGENTGGQYGAEITALIKRSGLQDRIIITGWASATEFNDYLAAADLGVQLRTHTRGETSAAVLDCMNHGLPVIANANGAMAELAPDATWMLPDKFSDEELIEALNMLYTDSIRREHIGRRASEIIHTAHAPESCARMYQQAIESAHLTSQCLPQDLIQEVVRVQISDSSDQDLSDIARSIAQNTPRRVGLKNLFVDVSALCHRSANSGTLRNIEEILNGIFELPLAGFRVEPVYAITGELGYRYGRDFTMTFLGGKNCVFPNDSPIDFKRGDIFLSLDPSSELNAQESFINSMRHHGVKIRELTTSMASATRSRSSPLDDDHNFGKWITSLLDKARSN